MSMFQREARRHKWKVRTEGITSPILKAQQRASYSPSLDLINMPKKETFDSEPEYYGTRFHEMTRGTGHKTRLAREGISEGHTFGNFLIA